MKRIIPVILAAVVLIGVLSTLGTRSSHRGDGTLQTDPAASTSTNTAGTTRPSLSTQSTTAPTLPPTTAPVATEPPTTAPPVTAPPELALLCRDYFVYDTQDAQFLTRSLDPNEKIYPASITKLFTAWVALEILDPKLVITAGNELDFVAADSSIAYIRPGHRLTAAMLVEGMLLPSGNDAAYVLATAAGRAVGGSDLTAAQAIACFVEQMNARAAAQGMTGTHFTNPDGYHDPGHYTTAADLLTIATLALENPQIRRCVGISEERVVYASGHTNTWHNSNLLVDPNSPYYCPDAIGLKTGNTDAAGYCLLSAFQRDGRLLIMGVFGCRSYMDRFTDSLKLYEMALELLT